MKSVVGQIVRPMSSVMYACLNQMASWNAVVSINADASSEMLFWKEHIRKLNSCDIDNAVSFCVYESTVFTDANDVGMGGAI
jgi:hypothetical protein